LTIFHHVNKGNLKLGASSMMNLPS